MDEVMAMAYLKLAFEYIEEPEAQDSILPRFTRSDDMEGQRIDIQLLVATAHMEYENFRVPHVLRVFAFNTLRGLARHYRSADPADVPPEMHIWAMGVASGDLEPPRRGRGGDVGKNILRNHAIGEMVAWQREHGATLDVAVTRVADVLGKDNETIFTVLRNLRKN